MSVLDQLAKGVVVEGLVSGAEATVVAIDPAGGGAVEVTYRLPDGRLGCQLVYRDQSEALRIVAGGGRWHFDADGATFRLVAEARRIRLAWPPGRRWRSSSRSGA